MRIAIIILGIIALIFLALKWDTLSPDSSDLPKEGTVLNSNYQQSESSLEDKTVICPKCNKGEESELITENHYFKTCKIHETIAINL